MDAIAMEPYSVLNFPASSNIPPANIFLVGSSPYLAVYGERLSRPSFDTCGKQTLSPFLLQGNR